MSDFYVFDCSTDFMVDPGIVVAVTGKLGFLGFSKDPSD